MKILLVHPGSSVSTHDVFMGLLEGLKAQGHQVNVYALDRKIAGAGKYLNAQRSVEIQDLKMDLPHQVSHEAIIFEAASGLLIYALTGDYDWVVVVSGMYIPLQVMHALRKARIRTALVLTESPYDEEKEAAWAKSVDVTFTNERTTARRLGVHYLPHAWRPGVHDLTKDQLEAQLPAKGAIHDCVFVGTGFGERVEWLKRFTDAGGPLRLYGTWPQDAMYPFLAKPGEPEWIVTNQQAAALYAHAGCSLNLYRTSKGDTGFSDNPEHVEGAESLNPRAYELAALGCFHISTPRAEVEEKFGVLIPQARTPEEGAEMVRQLLEVPGDVRDALRQQLRDCVKNDTWHERARQLTNVLQG